MIKHIITTLLLISVLMAGCKEHSSFTKEEISNHYFHLYILSCDEFLKGVSHVAADSLKRIQLKENIYYEIYQKTRN